VKIPAGLTEQDCIEVFYKVSREAAPKYMFGYHGKDDIVEDGVYECIKILETTDKFQPKPGKDLKQQLTNFLRVHVRRRLSNNRRDRSYRYASPNSKHNIAKYNLMHPLKIHSQGLTNSDIFSRDNTICEQVDHDEMIRRIREGLSITMLKDFLRWQSDVKIPSVRRKALFDRIGEILSEYSQEENN
jgi:hypothetical protein